MERLSRPTDTLPPDGSERPEDDLGTGYLWRGDGWLIEYRRAYIVCSETRTDGAGAVVIRNSARFFGRDRLPFPVYLSSGAVPEERLLSLSRDNLPGLCDWQSAADLMPPVDGIVRRAGRLLDRIDAFELQLSHWLTDPGGPGPCHLSEFIGFKLSSSPGGTGCPWIADIDCRMPPWFPQHPVRFDGITRREPDRAPPGMKTVLLSGPGGDLPA